MIITSTQLKSEPVLRQAATSEVTSIQGQNDIEKNHVENSSIFHRF